jgi:hypothetical protein
MFASPHQLFQLLCEHEFFGQAFVVSFSVLVSFLGYAGNAFTFYLLLVYMVP